MKRLSLLTSMLALVSVLHAQKVKYKDIFPDLEARKFNKVEPQLKAFLANEKNADHANAHYQMGLITEAHFLLQDIVADTSALFTYGDDALAFYRKSIPLITEKELKKNDEYYQSFYRRDLRTGEFGIKMSDVHLDIENKIASIETRMAAVRAFHAAVSDLTGLESELLERFNRMVSGATSYHDYLMRSDLEAISDLGDLQARFKAFDDKANEILKVGETLQVEDYYASIEYQSISTFETLPAVFPENNNKIVTWQFSDWASTAKAALNSEIFVMKNELTQFGKKLTNQTNALKSATPVDFTTSIPIHLDDKLLKYDPDPLPRNLLLARMKENTVRYLTDTTMNTMLLDSSVIIYQVNIADSILTTMTDLKKLLTLNDQKIDRGIAYYRDYTGNLGGAEGIREYISSTEQWIASITPYWEENFRFWDMRDNWGVTATDTIPLHVVDTSYHGAFVTKGFLDLPENEIMSWGFKRDSLIGFVARFGADRKLVWEDRFETDLLYVDVAEPFITDTLASDAGQVAFYLYRELVSGRSNINIVNVAIEGDVNWSVNTQCSKEPEYTTYSHAIGETTIFMYPQEAYPLTTGELGYFIINRDGEIR